MTRFLLSNAACTDMEEIKLYIGSLPIRPSANIAGTPRASFKSIVAYPHLGAPESALTVRFGRPARSRLGGIYRLYYFTPSEGQPVVEIIRILHNARDAQALLREL